MKEFFKKLVVAATCLGTAVAYSASTRILDVDTFRSSNHTKTWTPPAATDTLVGRASTDTLTNKTMSGTNNTFTNLPLGTGVTGVLPVANGGTNSSTALNNNRILQSTGGAIVEAPAITASRALVSDGSGIPTASAVTATEVGHLSGVTSSLCGINQTCTLTGKTLTSPTINILDNALTLQDNGDATKQAQFQLSSLSTGTTRTFTLPNADTVLVGTGVIQGLSNKSLNNTNLISISDANFIIEDDGDATKRAIFEASGITTGTTRFLTLPNVDTTLAGTDATQILTNKGISGASNTITNVSLTTGVTGTLPIGNGGTGQTTANAALNALLPTQTGHSGEVLKSDGTNTSWVAAGGGLYAGGQNLNTNNSWESNTSNWTASGGTYARVTAAANIVPPGVGAASWDPSASAQTLTANDVVITSGDGLSGNNGVLSCMVKTAATDLKMEVYDGTNVISPNATTDVAPSTSSMFTRYTVNFIFPASGTIKARFRSQSDSAIAYVDDCFLGLANGFNISQVSQASYIGMASWAVTSNCSWGTTSGSWTSVVDSDCPTPSVTGSLTSPTTANTLATKMSNVPPGTYYVVANFIGQKTGAGGDSCYYSLSDGTNRSGVVGHFANAVGGSLTYPITLTGVFTYTTAQSSIDWSVQQLTAAATSCTINNAFNAVENSRIQVYRFPTSSEIAYSSNLPVGPTVQKFTSGSGTYTTPAGVKYIRVRMVGGGGGGGGSGLDGAAGGTGSTGGTTSFGTSLLSCIGGTGGAGTSFGVRGGAGGTASLGTGPIGTTVIGGMGGPSFYEITNTITMPGGIGGSSVFGGAGSGGGYTTAGADGAVNTGGGGGGGGRERAVNALSGAGGGAGGYIDAIIVNPASSYAYSVGSGGSGGSAGTGGNAGGAGGSGYIEVTEYYGSQSTPLLVGSVTSNSAGAERVERISFNGGALGTSCTSSPCTIHGQSGAWATSVTRSGTGVYQINVPAGMFSSAPYCTCSGITPGTAVRSCTMTNDGSATWSATAIPIYITQAGTLVDGTATVICMGPR